jgi:hypothetical protein
VVYKTEQRRPPAARRVPTMKKSPPPRRKVPPALVAVVQPVAKRLARMEALLIEMRHEQDVKLKRIISLEVQLDAIAEDIRLTRGARHGALPEENS